MRVALLTNLTAQGSLPVLQRLAASSQIELRHVYFYNTLSAGSSSPLKILRQFGWKRVLVKAWEVASGKVRRKLATWTGARFVSPKSSYEFARLHNLSYSLTKDINSSDVIAQLQTWNVDVLIVCVCKNILRSRLLATPGLYFINIHPSLLPAYRGPTPTFWMRYNGAQQTGFTIHHMTTDIDQGAILAQQSLPLNCQLSDAQTELQVFARAAESIESTLANLANGLPAIQPDVDQSSSSYYSYPTAEDRRELKRRLRQRRLSLRERSGTGLPSRSNSASN